MWAPPPDNLILNDDEVHVWRAALDLTVSQVQHLKQTLSPDELARAARFRFPKDRDHFIVARGVLRTILGRYLGLEPSRLRFCYSPYGKPSLDRECGGDSLCFNLSHSHGLALFAVTRDRELGVDIEYLRRDLADEGIAQRFFSPPEVAALSALPTGVRGVAFFNCWTRKEAYIKARGEGLSFPLDQFDVSLAPGEPAALLRTEGDPQEASRWSLVALSPGADYVAALVVRGHDWKLEGWQWPGG